MTAAADPWAGIADDEPKTEPRENRLRPHLVGAKDIDALPLPTWQVRKLVPADALTVVWGLTESAKSFFTLDLAYCTVTGRPWHGRKVIKGPVLYIVGEGVRGIRLRQRAWLLTHGEHHDLSTLTFLKKAPQLREARDVADVLEIAADLKPVLIVVDTLSRATIGADENSSRDMAPAIEAAETIRAATGAAVVLVHHSGKDGMAYRGSGAIKANVDVMIEVRAEKAPNGRKVIKMLSDKSKDAGGFPAIELDLTVVLLGIHDDEGEELTSCVLTERDPTARGQSLDGAAGQVLDALFRAYDTDGASAAQLRKACAPPGKPEMPERTFGYAKQRLLKKGLIVNVGTDRRPHFKLTPDAEPYRPADCQPAEADPREQELSEGGTKVLEALRTVGEPMTADDVCEWIRTYLPLGNGVTFEVETVTKIFAVLVGKGLAEQLDSGAVKARPA